LLVGEGDREGHAARVRADHVTLSVTIRSIRTGSFRYRPSVARARVLISGALAAAKLLETGELAERIAALEAAMAQDRTPSPDVLFPGEPTP
jgi:hypothetical protein